MDKKDFAKEFENMKNKAEANAFSKLSLERPLKDEEFKRFKELVNKLR